MWTPRSPDSDDEGRPADDSGEEQDRARQRARNGDETADEIPIEELSYEDYSREDISLEGISSDAIPSPDANVPTGMQARRRWGLRARDRVRVAEFLSGLLLAIRRLLTWFFVIALVLSSYAWWGSETSPLRHLLPVAGWIVVLWFALSLLHWRIEQSIAARHREARKRRAARRRRKNAGPAAE